MKSFDMIFIKKESTDLLCISIVGSAFILNPKLLKNCWEKKEDFFLILPVWSKIFKFIQVVASIIKDL